MRSSKTLDIVDLHTPDVSKLRAVGGSQCEGITDL